MLLGSCPDCSGCWCKYRDKFLTDKQKSCKICSFFCFRVFCLLTLEVAVVGYHHVLVDAQQVTLTFDARGEWGWQLKTLDVSFAGARSPLRLFIEAEVE